MRKAMGQVCQLTALASLYYASLFKAGKNRVHLHLVVDDLDEATTEIAANGGRSVEPGHTREPEGFLGDS
jgi:predicted enzyme related to lactoylglutathione lyase